MDTKDYKVSDIFVPGGFPDETYVARDQHQLEKRVYAVRENLSKLVVVTGMTKSGKTVLVNRVFPRDSSIWIDGGSISDEDSFWDSINDKLCEATQFSISNSKKTDLSFGAKGSIGSERLFIKGDAGLNAGLNNSKEQGVTYSRNTSTKVAVIKGLQIKKIPLIIDDFHYIDKPIQKSIIRALKMPIMHGVPVIFIAIPNRKYDAIEVEREMTGRIENIEMPVWGIPELSQIARVGFEALNVKIPEDRINELSDAAYGSPFLMQEFCKELCMQSGIYEKQSITRAIDNRVNVENIFRGIAEHSGRPMFDKLKRGPRARTDRKQRKLMSGEFTDIYGVVMEALKHIEPGTESITYDQLRTGVKEILNEELPQKNEISRVLDKIAEISYTDESSTPVIDWQRDDDQITITDPFFAFFLKWSS